MKKEPEGPPVPSRRSVRFPSVPRAQLPRAAFRTRFESPDRRRSGRLAAPIRLRRPPTSPSGPAAVRRSRWTSLSLAAFRRSRATDPRWSVLRRPGGSLGPASQPSPASEAPFRLSDLAASLPVRCLRCAWIRRLALPPSVGAPGASSGLSSRPLGPLGAMRNVSAAPGPVNPAFPQVSTHICRSRLRDKE